MAFQADNEYAEQLVTQAGIRYFEGLGWAEKAAGELEVGSLSTAAESFFKAADLLAQASDLYEQVLAIGRRVGIKPAYIEAMKKVDYDRLQRDLRLRGDIWASVAEDGKNGDVLRLFRKMQEYINGIRSRSQALADVAAKGVKPLPEQVGSYFDSWNEATTFGHYTVILAREVERILQGR